MGSRARRAARKQLQESRHPGANRLAAMSDEDFDQSMRDSLGAEQYDAYLAQLDAMDTAPADRFEPLRHMAEELADLDRRRVAVMHERDQFVDDLRREGVQWSDIAAAAGVSHASLIERHRKFTGQPRA